MLKLHYYISNNGDGLASMRVCRTAEEAKTADEEQIETGGCFAKSTDGYVALKAEGNKIFYRELKWNSKKKKHDEIWVELLP